MNRFSLILSPIRTSDFVFKRKKSVYPVVKLVKSVHPVVKLVKKEKLSFQAKEPLRPHPPGYITNHASLLVRILYLSRLFKNYLIKTTTMSSSVDEKYNHIVQFDRTPPTSVRGMKILDKNEFKKIIRVPSIAVPRKGLQGLLQKVRPYVLKTRRVRSIVDLAENDLAFTDYKLLLLDPEKCGNVEAFSDRLKNIFEKNGVHLDGFRITEVELGYDHWTAAEIVRAVLPEDMVNVTGHAIVGHIAHLNLNEEALPYKYIIAQAILDKTPSLKTVVNKLNIIDNTYRNFQMEVLAGEENFVTRARENGCVFEMDFSKVYWNSKLGGEHETIVSKLERGDVLYDVFAGVGPFSVPAAKKGIHVYANDLNPSSFEYLEKNVKISQNKVKPEYIKCYNLDGREFIRTVVKQDLSERLRDVENKNTNIHFVMNLPAIAVEFLDAFRGLLADLEKDIIHSSNLPDVYCYFFTKSEDPKEELQERFKNALGEDLPTEHSIRFVRDVAPRKNMYCLQFKLSSFTLCEEVAACEDNLDTPVLKEMPSVITWDKTGSISGETERRQEETCDHLEGPDQKKLKIEADIS